MDLRLILVGLAPAGTVACSAPPLPESTAPPEERTVDAAFGRGELTLGPGDVVRVGVFGHPELSTLEDGARLDFEGQLSLPLVGFVPLDGLTPREAADELRRRFAAFVKEPDVTLNVVSFESRRFHVLGEVAEPGPYVLDRPMTALEAVALAGGPREGADRENACLLRTRDDEFLEVHLFDVATPGAAGLVHVRPGDLLFLRQTGSGRFREQVLPILQGLAPSLSALVNLGLVAEAIDD